MSAVAASVNSSYTRNAAFGENFNFTETEDSSSAQPSETGCALCYLRFTCRNTRICLLTESGISGIIHRLSGCGEAWYRAWFGSKRPRVRIPPLRPPLAGPPIFGRACWHIYLSHMKLFSECSLKKLMIRVYVERTRSTAYRKIVLSLLFSTRFALLR